ncbi:MAG TPA: chromosome segregation SMC family protein, partial [Pararhizobium sp.]|nr:chromosome segregation SMC family protein [Pararhizobium sp.]
MKFTKLRLIGFKSFVEPTEFIIEKGLTGVVGPNGCGKSNLVEAMRWVMGESSYKNMRASGMDDVIFSGSGNRPARNTAEVGLFLDNSDRTAPAAFNDADEIQVTRRIERESGSAYRINGKEARAKDVQLLFADASTGARSPSMVGQGRIGELIQAKPQARRQLLEEAAGISGLHSRRREAELRLRAAESNLERLDDVTSELEGQIESLKRQTRQANRFKALSADIRQSDATLLHIRWTQAKTAEAEAESALSAATSSVAEAAQSQMEAAKTQAIAAHKLPELRDGEAKAAAALQRLEIARAQIEEEAERVAKRKAELERRLAQLAEDIAREERLIADNAGILARLDEEERELQALLQDSDRLALESRAVFEAATAKLAASENAHGELTRGRAEAAAGRSQIERNLRDLRERIARLERQITDADRELAALSEKIAGLPDPEAKKQAVELAEERLQAGEGRVADADHALEEARSSEAAARGPVQEARSALNGLETEARTIRKMLNAGAGSDLFPPVVEKIKVARGYEAALGAALGDDLDLPIDTAAPAHWSHVEGPGSDPALPEGATPLAEFVTAPPELARRLAQVGVVTVEQGAALQQALRPGQKLVSRDGALWRWDGYVARADAPTAAALRLAQKNRLAELDGQAIEATAVVRAAEAALSATEASVRNAADEQRQAQEARRVAQQAVARARDELAEAERASGQFASRRAVLTESRSQINTQFEEAKAGLEEAETALACAPDLSNLDADLAAAARDVAEDRAALAETRAAHEGLERENTARKKRLEAIAGERKAWAERATNA